jgi:hypothetical protein
LISQSTIIFGPADAVVHVGVEIRFTHAASLQDSLMTMFKNHLNRGSPTLESSKRHQAGTPQKQCSA